MTLLRAVHRIRRRLLTELLDLDPVPEPPPPRARAPPATASAPSAEVTLRVLSLNAWGAR